MDRVAIAVLRAIGHSLEEIAAQLSDVRLSSVADETMPRRLTRTRPRVQPAGVRPALQLKKEADANGTQDYHRDGPEVSMPTCCVQCLPGGCFLHRIAESHGTAEGRLCPGADTRQGRPGKILIA